MLRVNLSYAVVVAVLLLGTYGCSSPTKTEPTKSNPPASTDDGTKHTPAAHDHGEHKDHGAERHSDMEKMKAALAKLSPGDRASAEKQHVCPVSGEMLGTMNAPLKLDVKGQQVWICCDGCKDELLGDPDKFLAKLKKQ